MSAMFKDFSLFEEKKMSGYDYDNQNTKESKRKKDTEKFKVDPSFINRRYNIPKSIQQIYNEQPPNNSHILESKDRSQSIITVEASGSVPVVKNAPTMSLYELAKNIAISSGIKLMNGNLHICNEKPKYYQLLHGEEEEKVLRKLVPSHLRHKINSISIMEMSKWMKSMDFLCVNTDSADKKQKNYINFKNGILSILSGKRVEAEDGHYFTNFIDADYPFDSECTGDNFLNFVSDISGGDKQIEMLLQEAIGLALSEIRDLKIAVYFYGMPDSGKSLLIEVIRNIVGEEFCSNVSLHQLSTDQYAIAQLYHKKLNTFAEMGEIDLKRLDIFKTLTGNDWCNARHIYGKPFNFRNKALFLLAGNSFPKLKTLDFTNAFFNRLLVIPFMYSTPKENQDKGLKEKLLKERSFIVKWGLIGLRRLISNGFVFTTSKVAEEIKKEYISEHNSFQAFIENACILRSDGYTFSYELEYAYSIFCEKNCLIQVTKAEIHKILKNVYKLLYKKQSINGSKRNGYFGLELGPEYKFQISNSLYE